MPSRSSPRGEVCADRLGVGVDAGRTRGSGKALRQRPPERIARGREAAAEIELARRPAAPVGGEPGQQRDQGIDRRAPDPRIGRVAAEVQMDPGDVEVRIADLALADRQHVLGRDPGLVALDRIRGPTPRRPTSRRARRGRRGRGGTAGGRALACRDARRPCVVRSSSARLSSVIRTPARTARSSSSSSFIGPFREIRPGSVPVRRAASSSPSPKTSQPVPSSVRIRRRASD